VTGARLSTIDALIDKSLLAFRTAADGSKRLTILETVREYALERLAEDPDVNGVRRAHLEYYAKAAKGAASQLWRAQESKALTLLDREIDNIRGALQWALAGVPALAVRIAGPLGEYSWIRQDPDGLDWVDAALAAGDDQAEIADRAHAQLARSLLFEQRGQPEAQADAANCALELYRELDDDEGIATALIALAHTAFRLDDAGKEPRAYAEEACRHARESGDEPTLAMALAVLANAVPSDKQLDALAQAGELMRRNGMHRPLVQAYGNAAYAALAEGRPADALQLLEVSVSAAEKLGDPGTRGYLCGNLGLAHLFLGDLAQAREQFTQEVRLSVGQAFQFGAEEGLAGLAAIAAAERRYERAAKLIGAALALGRWDRVDRPILDRLERDYFAPARAQLGATAWRHAQEQGAAMSYADAIQFAIRHPMPSDRPAADHAHA
jgi:tetratricopeptide (TPR) repeat protein